MIKRYTPTAKSEVKPDQNEEITDILDNLNSLTSNDSEPISDPQERLNDQIKLHPWIKNLTLPDVLRRFKSLNKKAERVQKILVARYPEMKDM